jgi:hypothetical protein
MRSLLAGVDDGGRDIHAERPSFRNDVFELRETPPPVRPAGTAS